MQTNSRTYSGETIDLGFYRVAVRGGRVYVETDGDRKPWLDKRGNTIYVVADQPQKLDMGGEGGLN